MKRKSNMGRMTLGYWPPMVVGLILVVVLTMLCPGGISTAEAAGKQPGKAPADAAPAAIAAQKPAEQPVEKPAEKPAEPAAMAPIINPEADKLLREMGEYLKNAQQFSFQAEITFDDVLPSGQKIQFAATEDLAVHRPGEAYIEYRGDLGVKRFWYKGDTITLYDPGNNLYATEKVPAKFDEAIDQVMKEFGFSPPLVDILYSDPYKLLIDRVQFGLYIGLSMVDGIHCHHLAFVDKYIDWQIWIEDGKQLVPRKILITYKTIPGAPQFTAVLSDWDFATPLANRLFSASLPAGAEKIEFARLAKSLEKKE